MLEIPSHVPPELVRPFELEFRGRLDDLFPRFDALRREGRVIWLEHGQSGMFGMPPQGAWLFTRAEDIRAALQDPSVFSSAFSVAAGPGGVAIPPMIPIFLDPPEHTQYRRVLAPLFAPPVVAAMEDGIRTRVTSLIDSLTGRGACEFVADFAIQFPTRVFTSWIGLPEEETHRFVALTSALIHGTPAQRMAASLGAVQVLNALIADRTANPRDDLMSEIIAQELDGRRLAHDELLRIAMLLFMAGLDTVAAALSFAFWHLAKNPAHREAIVGRTVPTGQMVEELLRRHSFVNLPRVVVRDTEFAGASLRKGDAVVLSLALASRDPDEFEAPTEVELERSANRHYAFGVGPHRCLGSHLARLEMRLALEEWHARIPDYRLDGEVGCYAGVVMGVTALPLRWS